MRVCIVSHILSTHTHVYLHICIKCWSSDLRPSFIIWSGKGSITWAASLCVFVKPKGFITKRQGTVLVHTHACCVYSCWGEGRGRRGWACMGSISDETISVLHDVEPKLCYDLIF